MIVAASNCKALIAIRDLAKHRKMGLEHIPSMIPIIHQIAKDYGCTPVVSCEDEEAPCEVKESMICSYSLNSVSTNTDLHGTTTFHVTGSTGGLAPYTYLWSFNPVHFSYISGQGTDTLTLKLLVSTNTPISVVSEDANRCRGTISDNFSSSAFPSLTLNCAGSVLSNTVFIYGIPYTGTLTIPYTGGNAAAYKGFTQVFNGLTISIPDGSLAMGAGNLIFQIAGIPTATGPLNIPMDILGTICNVPITIFATPCNPVGIGVEVIDFGLTDFTLRAIWNAAVSPHSGYTIYLTVGATVNPPVTIPAGTLIYDFQVGPGVAYSITIEVNCLDGQTSGPATASGFAPGTPTCADPTLPTVIIGAYNIGTDTYNVRIQWSAVAGAVGYILTNITSSLTYVTSTTFIDLQLQSSVNFDFNIKTNCSFINSIGVDFPVPVPSAPLLPLPDGPTLNQMTVMNVGHKWTSMWITLVDSTQTGVTIEQAPIFSPTYISNSGFLMKGVGNGYAPLPPGFGPNDVYFNNGTPPVGYNLTASGPNRVKFGVNWSLGVADYEAIQNVDTSLGRQSPEDYIPLYLTNLLPQKPDIVADVSVPGQLTVTVDPLGLVYDVSGVVNIFVMNTTFGVDNTYLNQHTNSHTYTLLPGNYMVYAEMQLSTGTTFLSAWPELVTVV